MIATKSAKKSARSSTKSALVLNHTETLDAGDLALSELIASLGMPDEVVEEPVVTDAMLDAAVSGAEAVEAMTAIATPDGVIDGATPTGDASDVKPAKVAKVKAEKKAKEPKEPKAAATPRKHYTDKTERLKDKLGAGLTDYTVLTLADAGVEEADLTKVMEDTLTIIRSMNKKKQNRAVLLIEFLAGKKAHLNEVIARAAKILLKDGFISTGNDGNLFKDLIARPYSAGAARAMGGNTVSMMTDLKLLLADGKGKFVPNPDSLLLGKLQSMLTAA